MLDKVAPSTDSKAVLAQFKAVRSLTEELCEPLEIEDYNLQAIAETSPAKWHLAHTTWFFETFILKAFIENYSSYNEQYEYLFNSYYNGIGEQFPRPKRSLLSRPSVPEVIEYRATITQKIDELVSSLSGEKSNEELASEVFSSEVLQLVILGINHEQQHQELLLTDLKFNLYQNPLLPSYRIKNKPEVQSNSLSKPSTEQPLSWVTFTPELISIGKDFDGASDSKAGSEFIFDNESPEHQHYLQPFEIADRLVTNGEFLQFIEEGGYEKSEFWLSDGWDEAQKQGWEAPLYWFKEAEQWYQYSLNGTAPLDYAEPLVHVSFYEADAFARWAASKTKGIRLVTEQEWEYVAKQQLADKSSLDGNFLDKRVLHPVITKDFNSDAQHRVAQNKAVNNDVTQLFGDVWEWTSSSYHSYPGFEPLEGTVGEYNGKFMANQFVLRGGSCVTSQSHMRPTYRNFFYPEARWQFSGIRLARYVTA